MLVAALIVGRAPASFDVSVADPAGAPSAELKDGAVCDWKGKRANLDFTLKDLAGNDVSLNAFRGKVLLVDFWATWCPPCKLEVPGFVELYAKYRSRGFEILGLVTLDKFENAGPFAKEYGMDYPILDAVERDDVEMAYGPLAVLPTSFVVDREGRVCAEHPGYTTKEQFEAEIRGLL